MGFYPDVATGDKFQPSVKLENDVRHMVNAMNGFSDKSISRESGNNCVIKVHNATSAVIAAGTAVQFNTNLIDNNIVGCKAFQDSNSPWGVLTNDLAANEIGDCVVSGAVWIKGKYTSKFVSPKSGGGFAEKQSGNAQVIVSGESNTLINIGASSQEDACLGIITKESDAGVYNVTLYANGLDKPETGRSKLFAVELALGSVIPNGTVVIAHPIDVTVVGGSEK